MAELWQGVHDSVSPASRLREGASEGSARDLSSKGRLWIVLDVITVAASAVLATIYRFRTDRQTQCRIFCTARWFMATPWASCCAFVRVYVCVDRDQPSAALVHADQADQLSA